MLVYATSDTTKYSAYDTSAEGDVLTIYQYNDTNLCRRPPTIFTALAIVIMAYFI